MVVERATAAEVGGDSGVRHITVIPKVAKATTTTGDHVVEAEVEAEAGDLHKNSNSRPLPHFTTFRCSNLSRPHYENRGAIRL